MLAFLPKPTNHPDTPRPQSEADEELQDAWFVRRPSRVVPLASPASLSPTGDDEVDAWLR